ncbi:hypothetical protein [Streptomyces sp. DH8]|nr:hypothetical protein [Streptomyces sp. DH8]
MPALTAHSTALYRLKDAAGRLLYVTSSGRRIAAFVPLAVDDAAQG